MSAEQFGITTVYLNPSFLIKSEQLQDLCRLCGCANDQLMPIFSGEGLENNIQNKIQRYLPIIKVIMYFKAIINDVLTNVYLKKNNDHHNSSIFYLIFDIINLLIPH